MEGWIQFAVGLGVGALWAGTLALAGWAIVRPKASQGPSSPDLTTLQGKMRNLEGEWLDTRDRLDRMTKRAIRHRTLEAVEEGVAGTAAAAPPGRSRSELLLAHRGRGQ